MAAVLLSAVLVFGISSSHIPSIAASILLYLYVLIEAILLYHPATCIIRCRRKRVAVVVGLCYLKPRAQNVMAETPYDSPL
ncbi:hypothetical protein OPV22_012860 [Ensete ventricosum]|uniref:Uncharacterized protein n=1 Tax=Ensete ventricosum TaxID=4639 RepID=A0AAV8PHH2_ENSVE|nr:hypothetical protein OPV22_012860 [Ensete ventricosum]